jgi:hypothetical protein
MRMKATLANQDNMGRACGDDGSSRRRNRGVEATVPQAIERQNKLVKPTPFYFKSAPRRSGLRVRTVRRVTGRHVRERGTHADDVPRRVIHHIRFFLIISIERSRRVKYKFKLMSYK